MVKFQTEPTWIKEKTVLFFFFVQSGIKGQVSSLQRTQKSCLFTACLEMLTNGCSFLQVFCHSFDEIGLLACIADSSKIQN